MGRLVDLDDLVTVDDIVERVGRVQQLVHRWTQRDGFPVEVVKLGRLHIYLWSEVEPWVANYMRTKSKGGRPHKHSTAMVLPQ